MSRSKSAPPQQPFFLLSIDPAAAAGWAFFIAGKPVLWGDAEGSTWQTLHNAFCALAPYIGNTQESHECVIEDAIPGRSFKATMTLGRRRGLAQAAAESSVGFNKFTYIGPSTWQNGLGWRKGLDTKEWSLAYVKQRYGITGISHDCSDALALGAWHLDSFKQVA